MNFIASDLSLRKKNENIVITRDNWFKVRRNREGRIELSKKFRENVKITDISIENHQRIEKYEAKWKGSNEQKQPWNWSEKWKENPENLGKVNAVKIKLSIKSNSKNSTYIQDINLNTEFLN